MAVRRSFFAPMADVPDHPLWGATERAVARWVMVHGGSRNLALLAAWATYVDGRGDSALDLGADNAQHLGMTPLAQEALAALQAEPLVAVLGEEGETRRAPFVIDQGHFYLWRNLSHERALAEQLQRRCGPGQQVAPLASQDLAFLFNGAEDGRDEAQRLAVGAVRGTRLFVLTGGPGTGKTSTALRMLLMLAKERIGRGLGAPLIRLAAPSGKAAQRLGEAIAKGVAAMGTAQSIPEDWRGAVAALESATTSTLHRLLGGYGSGDGFAHHADNPIAADIVVVDEASMASLAVWRYLLEALREETVLILLGDADQLTSVETGSVLLDLVCALERVASSNMVRLVEGFRATPELSAINNAILQGSLACFATAWRQATEKGMARRRQVHSLEELKQALRSWAALLRPWLQGCQNAAGTPEAVHHCLEGLRRFQLLCALREGPFGAKQANAQIAVQLRRYGGVAITERWYPGRAVMITCNDAQRSGLLNGDVGLCLPDAQGRLMVWFERPQSSGLDDVVAFAPHRLPPHQGALAITIHKSQGSEYDHVAVLLPPEADNPILSRQLLYTAVSRAKRTVELWGSDAAIRQAIVTPIARQGRLETRLLSRLAKGQ